MDTALLSQEEFLEELMDGLAAELADHDLQFDHQIVHKANEELDGLTIRLLDRDDGRISPTIYPDRLYEDYADGRSLEDMVQELARIIDNPGPEFDIDNITPEAARDHLLFSLVNTRENEEWLKGIPHEEIGDLSAIPRWHLNPTASFVVTDQVAQNLHLTREEVLDIARENTERSTFTVTGMYDTMAEIMRGQGMSEEQVEALIGPMREDDKMYVITNEAKADGAAAILSDATMQAAYDRIGEGFYILPSSRHEVLAVPESAVEHVEDLRTMVAEVNATEVSKSDFLSDNVYFYNGREHEITPLFDESGKLIEHEDHDGIADGMDTLDDGMGGR